MQSSDLLNSNFSEWEDRSLVLCKDHRLLCGNSSLLKTAAAAAMLRVCVCLCVCVSVRGGARARYSLLGTLAHTDSSRTPFPNWNL